MYIKLPSPPNVSASKISRWSGHCHRYIHKCVVFVYIFIYIFVHTCTHTNAEKTKNIHARVCIQIFVLICPPCIHKYTPPPYTHTHTHTLTLMRIIWMIMTLSPMISVEWFSDISISCQSFVGDNVIYVYIVTHEWMPFACASMTRTYQRLPLSHLWMNGIVTYERWSSWSPGAIKSFIPRFSSLIAMKEFVGERLAHHRW